MVADTEAMVGMGAAVTVDMDVATEATEAMDAATAGTVGDAEELYDAFLGVPRL